MARKKENRNITSTTVTHTDNNSNGNSNSQPHPQPRSPRDLSPDNKMDSLKTLNNLLLKETMENRAQIDHLKSELQDLSDDQPLASDLEREVRLIVLSRSLADQDAKLRSLEESFDLAARENGEMKKASVLMRSEVDSRRREVGELEARIGDLERENGEMREKLVVALAERDEMGRRGTKSAEAYESVIAMMDDVEKEREELSARHEEEVEVLMEEIDANVKRISSLEEEGRKLLEVRGRLEAEVGELKAAFGLLKKEEEGLRLKVFELEKKNDESEEEINRNGARIIALEEEMEEKEKGFESTVGELTSKLDEMRLKMEREKDELERLREKQEAEITELKNELEKLHLDGAGLQKTCEEYSEKITQLQDERDAMKREVGMLEEKMADKEKVFVASLKELEENLGDLTAKMAQVSVEKDEVDSARMKQEVEILELKEELEKLNINARELQDMCRRHDEQSSQLQNEKDEAVRDLAAQAEESAALRVQVEELTKHGDETCAEITKLSASLDSVLSEKEEGKRLVESLTQEKASLENRLFAAEEKLDEMEKKLKCAQMVSDKTLTFLKSAAEGQENGAACDAEIDLRPFADAMEGIKCTLRSKAAKIEQMNEEMKSLQAALGDAERKKKQSGLLMWLYPATTTLLAAISFAYAARGR